MPLSKERMKLRKRADRAKIRFDIPVVKPKYGIEERTGKKVELDADGNPIPGY